jgi:flavin reductase (DIM6/NTAB) family NADH-FMN oxidoreductase RutF
MTQCFHADGLAGAKLLAGEHGEMFTAIAPRAHYFGSLVVLLTTTNPDGSTNITPISSAWSLGDHYVLGLGTANRGYANLMRTREVVLNLPEAALVRDIEAIAMTTGMHPVPPQKSGLYRTAVDKWALSGWTPLPGTEGSPHRIAECPVQIEAVLVNAMPLEDGLDAVQVRVRRVHAREDLVTDTGHIDVRAWEPLFYTFRHYFGQGEHLGENPRAEQRLMPRKGPTAAGHCAADAVPGAGGLGQSSPSSSLPNANR